MTTLGSTVPYYGGRQSNNPATVFTGKVSPPSPNIAANPGDVYVDTTLENYYGAVGKLAGNQVQWALLAGSSGAITSVLGTAAQITATPSGSSVTLSLPAVVTAPGSLATTTTLASGTTLTAGSSLSVTTTATIGTGLTVTTGNITATAGNLVATAGQLQLNGAASRIIINAGTASTAPVGVSGAMSGNPGTVTVTTSACTTSSKILYSRATTGGTPGEVSITTQSAGSFVLTSTGNETSTFNYLIIN
jgi:hypothetical protein